jgi:TonB family protein
VQSFAQQNIRLTFNPNTKQEHIYRAESTINSDFKSIVYSSFNANKQNDKSFIIEEKIKEINVFEGNEQLFSLNTFLEPFEERYFIQQFLKSSVFKRKISSTGEVLSPYSFEEIIAQSPYGIGLDDELELFLDVFQKNGNYFYLNKDLSVGDSITEERQFLLTNNYSGIRHSTLPISYSVVQITDKQTVFTYKAQGEYTAYRQTINYSIEGLFIIENKSGLPLYMAEVSKANDEMVAVTTINRDDFKQVSADLYYQVNINNEYYPDEPLELFPSTSENFPNLSKSDAEAKLAAADYALFLEIKSRNRSNLIIGSTEDCSNIKIACNNLKLRYCNQEIRHINNIESEILSINPLEGYNIIKSTGIGKDCPIEEVSIDITSTVFYEKDSTTLYPKDVEKKLNVPFMEPYIAQWQNNIICLSNMAFYIIYNDKGQALTQAIIQPYSPFYAKTATLLGVKEQNVSQEQAFLFAPLFDCPMENMYYKYTFKEPVSKIVVYHHESSITQTTRLTATGIDKKKAEKIYKKANERHAKMYSEYDDTEYENLPDSITEEEVSLVYEEEMIEISDSLNEQLIPPPPLDDNNETDEEEPVFIIVESMPEYPGGQNSMITFIQEQLKYPQDAIDEGIQGRVFVNFVVEKDGSLSGIKVIRGVSGSLDAEAIRVIESMPKWIAGMQREQNVRVSQTVPVSFILPE